LTGIKNEWIDPPLDRRVASGQQGGGQAE